MGLKRRANEAGYGGYIWEGVQMGQIRLDAIRRVRVSGGRGWVRACARGYGRKRRSCIRLTIGRVRLVGSRRAGDARIGLSCKRAA